VDLETLFWLLIIAIPILRRLFGKKGGKPVGTKPKPRPKPVQQSSRTSADFQPEESKRQVSPFQEALQQIQEALAEAREEQESQRPKVEAPPPRPKPKPKPQMGEFRAPEPSRRSSEDDYFESRKGEHVKRPTEARLAREARTARPTPEVATGHFYDDDFQRQAPFEETFHETVHAHVPPSEDVPARQRTVVDYSKWRQAYVMHEVLKRPRSMRPWTFHEPGKDD
jgi:hypothetical protein